eukprot:TRINITY_DN1599_c0_g1_i1.p1 TRINITY_DN1599_c0_g1~~TRINITY_DN1599_c0_g1_i1.p1  ORF type:complete len:334 (+),score=69.65 TRINITY_DN1599_c0_g1_i1:146-1147(+)
MNNPNQQKDVDKLSMGLLDPRAPSPLNSIPVSPIPTTTTPPVENKFERSARPAGRLEDMDIQVATILKSDSMLQTEGFKVAVEHAVWTAARNQKIHFIVQHSFNLIQTKHHLPGYTLLTIVSLPKNKQRLEGHYSFAESSFGGSYAYSFDRIPLTINIPFGSGPQQEYVAIDGMYKGRGFVTAFEFSPRTYQLQFVQTISDNIKGAVQWIWEKNSDPAINYYLRIAKGSAIWNAKFTNPGWGGMLAYTLKLTDHSWWSAWIKKEVDQRPQAGIGFNYNFAQGKMIRAKLDTNWKLAVTFKEILTTNIMMGINMVMDYKSAGFKFGLNLTYHTN